MADDGWLGGVVVWWSEAALGGGRGGSSAWVEGTRGVWGDREEDSGSTAAAPLRPILLAAGAGAEDRGSGGGAGGGRIDLSGRSLKFLVATW